jgi:hypothetical protein
MSVTTSVAGENRTAARVLYPSKAKVETCMSSQRYRVGPFALLALCAAIGCGGGAKTGQVEGTVTVNGNPLLEGAILFIPVNGDTATAGGQIAEGKYSVEVPVTQHQVQISANVIDTQKTPPNATADQIVMKQLVPNRYNVESELVMDVVGGVNKKDFALTNP